MPVIDPTICRVHPHELGRMYLYVYRPATVFAAQVDGGGADPGYDVQAIPFDNVDPAYGTIVDVKRGHTVWIGSSAGAKDGGVVRVRIDGVGGETHMHVSEHEIYLHDNVYITVKEEYRLWHVSPFLDVTGPTWYKDCDDITAPAQLAFPPAVAPAGGTIDDIYMPVPVMGPHSIEFLTAGAATHNFDWRQSWMIGPNSGALTYAGTFPGGPVVVPNVSASNGTVTWNSAGARWVTLVLTDSMGANPAVTAYDAHRLYITLDPDWTVGQAITNGLYVDFMPSPRLGSVDQGGFTMDFTVYVDASEEDFPDEALVIWFFDGGTQEDIIDGDTERWKHRQHIHFIGYIVKGSTHKEPETGQITFSAMTLEGLMKATPIFPNFLEIDATPTVWTQAHGLTVERAAYLHMRWMSSLLEMADVLFVPRAPTQIGEHEFPEGDLYSQLDGLVNRDYRYRIGCDPLGTVYFNKDPQFLTRPNPWDPPAGIATIMTIADEDWKGALDLPEPLIPQTGYVLASGNAYTAGVLTPLFSNAPGPVPLERGRRDRSFSRIICTTQGALDEAAGLALAYFNNDFPDIPVTMDGQYYIGHLFPMEFVRLDVQGLPLPAGTTEGTKRDVDLSDERFIPRRSQLQIIYDQHGAPAHAQVSVNVEKVTWGPDGRTLVYPTEPPPPPGPDEGPDGGDWVPPPPPPPDGSPGDGSLLYFVDYTSGHFFRTRNARAADPADVVYEDLGYVGAGLRDIALDSWNPKNVAMVCGDDGVYLTENLNDSSPDWTLVLDLSDVRYKAYNVASSICQKDLWMVSIMFDSDTESGWYPYVFWTIDRGENWDYIRLSEYLESGSECWVECSSHNANKAWVTWDCDDGRSFVARTTTQWSSKTNYELTCLGDTGGQPVANSYHRHLNNTDDNLALYGQGQGYTNRAVTCWCTADVGTCTVSYPGGEGATGERVVRLGGYTWGTNKYWCLTYDGAEAKWRFYVSDDAITWTLQYTFSGASQYISGWPYDGERFYACQNGTVAPILISDDRGEIWQEQTGNWASLGYSGDIRCCVPVWTE